MIETNNLIFGGTIILLNIIPIILKKYKWFNVTVPLSLLLGAIKVLFI